MDITPKEISLKKLIATGLVMLCTGCATQQFDLKANLDASPNFQDNQTFWVGGIGQQSEVDAAKVCGGAGKVGRVETKLTPGNVGLTLITLGIYSPREISITCTK